MITLRKAESTEQDIALLYELSHVSFLATYKDILSAEQLDYMMDMMYSLDSLKEQLIVLDHRYYIAYKESVPCGYVSISEHEDQIFMLNKIYLLPSYQGQGIGRELIDFVKAYALEHSATDKASVTLHVNRNNKAKQFYEHLGFRIDSAGDFDIGAGFIMNDYIMRVDLQKSK